MDKQLENIFSYAYWRQSIDLRNGLHTPGHVHADLWEFLSLPEDLKGRSFLDVGANDGMFSFEAERRGAAEVVASDLYKDKIDSMKNGWSSEGLMMAKEFLNSHVSLHQGGVYHLQELGKKFDVVFMNDIINWLEDIELAVQNLASATGGRLYLADGFIADNSSPKREKQSGPSLRYMYNVSYISQLLEKNGFRIEQVKELNYQKVFIRDFINVPEITIPLNTPVYRLPYASSSTTPCDKPLKLKSGMERNGFYYIHKKGWVKKEDVAVKHFQPSALYKAAKASGLLELYYRFLLKRNKKQTNIAAYVIRAAKVETDSH